MGTTQPIRDRKQLQAFKEYYHTEKENLRNYALIAVGLNTALRISDILHLTWDMVFTGKKVRSHVTLKERKTGKESCTLLNKKAAGALLEYYSSPEGRRARESGNPYLFPSPKNADMPLSRSQAYRIIRQGAEKSGVEGRVSCHSLRKTFGYHAWKQGVPPAVLMDIYNHSSYLITVRYLCIWQDDRDEVFAKLLL